MKCSYCKNETPLLFVYDCGHSCICLTCIKRLVLKIFKLIIRSVVSVGPLFFNDISLQCKECGKLLSKKFIREIIQFSSTGQQIIIKFKETHFSNQIKSICCQADIFANNCKYLCTKCLSKIRVQLIPNQP